MQKITPCLWFDNQAEEAAKFYVSIFKILKSEALPAMAKREQRSPECQRER